MNKTLKQLSDKVAGLKKGGALIPDWLIVNSKTRRFFYALSLLYGLYILPVLLADRYYQDDLTRSLRGVTGWENDGRPLTELIMRWLCGGLPINDISPLPLLLSILFLSYIVTLYCQQNLPDNDTIYPYLYVGFAVIANPFMLSTFSYKFDCITMVMALCAALIPYLLPERTVLWKTFCFSGIMCLIILITYQPCSGIYISLCMLELLIMICTTSINLPRLIIRACALCTSVFIYYFFIMKRYIPDSGWQPDSYRFAMGSGVSPISAFLQNYNNFFILFDRYTAGVPRKIMILTAVLVVGGMFVIIISLYKKLTGIHRIWQILYVFCLPVLALTGCLLPLLALKPTFFTISAHTMIALCGFTIWLGLMIYFLSKKSRLLTLVLTVPCILFCFTFSYSYGNALKSQKQYEEYIVYHIVHDIETLNADGQYHYLSVGDGMPYARQTAMLCDKYPLYRDLVPVYISNSSYLGGALLSHYTQEDLAFTDITQEESDLIAAGSPVIQNAIYSCYINDDKIIICFSGQIK